VSTALKVAPIKISKPSSGLTRTQRARRRGRVTATRAAMIAGESEFGGPLRAYREIIGVEREHRNVSTEFGTFAEPLIARRYAKLHGVRLRKPGTILHPAEGSWLCASLDYVVLTVLLAWDYLLEIKTADESQTEHWGLPGTSQVPGGYIVQAAIECACAGLGSLVWAVMIGRSFYEYRYERDLRFEADLIGLLREFHECHVLPRIAPNDDDRMLWTVTIWPRDDGSTIDLREDGDVCRAARRLREITRLVKSLEREGKALRGEVAEKAQGAASVLTSEGEFRHKMKRVGSRPDATAMERLARSLGAADGDIQSCYSAPSETREFSVPYGWRNDKEEGTSDGNRD
jgi:predicted phage-related endonuclease